MLSDTTSPTIARLAALARESGLTQAEIAERAGTTQAAVSRAISGERDPAASTLERIAAAIGYRLEFVMDDQ